MILADYDPNPLQTALTLYNAKNEENLRAHFENMTSTEKKFFETELLGNISKNVDFITWYLQNCASTEFIIFLGVFVSSIRRKKKG